MDLRVVSPRSPTRTAAVVAVALGLVLAAGVPSAGARPDGGAAQLAPARYRVVGPAGRADVDRVARTGAAIDDIEAGTVDVTATGEEAARLRSLGFDLVALAPPGPAAPGTRLAPAGFPRADAGYHDYAEMRAELDRVVADHPAIARVQVIGTSHEGRAIVALKISDNVGTDEAEPEVLYDAHQHAREHLTVEMALYLAHLFTDGYGTDARVTGVVDSREIWIVPDVNPDGGEYDIATGSYRSWRKNRQPTPGSRSVGTDLNRNWGYGFGCCGGSSGSPSSGTYRGPAAFSAPETRALRDFVLGRRVGGVQQITVAIDFHTFQELVLWPYGYTRADTAPGLGVDQEATFRILGRQLAATNGYTPEQASDLYITDGDILDWLWGDQGIFAYTFEMYPTSTAAGGFYPPDEVIVAQTARNREASLQLAEYADCPYRVIGKAAQYCAGSRV